MAAHIVGCSPLLERLLRPSPAAITSMACAERIPRWREGALDELRQVALEPRDQLATPLEVTGRGSGLLEAAT
jgi:hypothetical protein